MYGISDVKRYYARAFARAARYHGGDLDDPVLYRQVMHRYAKFRGAEQTSDLDAQLKVIFDHAVVAADLATARYYLERPNRVFELTDEEKTAAQHVRWALLRSEDMLFEKLKAYTDSLPKPRIIAARAVNDIRHGFYLGGLLHISDPKQPLHATEKEEVYNPSYQNLRSFYGSDLERVVP